MLDEDYYKLEMKAAEAAMIPIYNELYRRNTTLLEILKMKQGRKAFVERCLQEKPEVLPFYEKWEHHKSLPEVSQPCDELSDGVVDVDANLLYARAREYYLLRRMAEVLGENPGPDVLEKLNLHAMNGEFAREEAMTRPPQPR